ASVRALPARFSAGGDACVPSFLVSAIGCFPGSLGFASGGGLGFPSGSIGTGGSTVGRNVSSLGENFAASSGVANSIATNAFGTSARAGHDANNSREVASASSFFLRNLIID